jgi:hypothetical protein
LEHVCGKEVSTIIKGMLVWCGVLAIHTYSFILLVRCNLDGTTLAFTVEYGCSRLLQSSWFAHWKGFGGNEGSTRVETCWPKCPRVVSTSGGQSCFWQSQECHESRLSSGWRWNTNSVTDATKEFNLFKYVEYEC